MKILKSNQKYVNLVEHNVEFTKQLFNLIDISFPDMYYSSNIETRADRTERLVDICKFSGVNNILTGWGASSKNT